MPENQESMLNRILTSEIRDSLLNSGQIIVLYGARQTGKTTLASEILKYVQGKVLRINADENKYLDVLSSRDFDKINLLISGYDMLFIDEAQRISDIGINLKIIHDNRPDLKILVTGSSSFDLANKLNEPLTGRTLTYRLFPFSLSELKAEMSVFEMQENLEKFMVYGLYPGIYTVDNASLKEKKLTELSTAYIYKDIFELSSVRNTSKVRDLLRMLAFQIGSEVSIPELGRALALSQETVNQYIDLLENAFIVFRMGAFSGNLRKEISKKSKVYFWDTGIRNSLINNFSGLNFRNDIGPLWENFVVAERMKFLSYSGLNTNSYFWRTYTGAEIDYMEERNGTFKGFEIKWSKNKVRFPQAWIDIYGNDVSLINRSNFFEFLV